MKSVMRLAMAADPRRVFDLAVEVERWPELLPHYRYVRRLPDPAGERRFAMGARRGAIPVRWEAVQRPYPDDGVIEFVHTGGVTRGMRVAWRIAPRNGGADVSLEHELRLGWPLVGEVVASRLIGPHFVDAIAGRTLRRVKQLAEAAS